MIQGGTTPHRSKLPWIALIVLVAIGTISPGRLAHAWGWTAHHLITSAAVDALPPPLRTFYAAHREFVAGHSVDPDRWRDDTPLGEICTPERGLPVLEGDEAPRHYLDADAVAVYPFREIPRDFNAYRTLAGDELVRWGTAPWSIEAYTRLLAEAMREASDVRRILCRSAILGHYVGDFSQPLHLSKNYNGQLSGLDGIHFRFEADLVEYYDSALVARITASAPQAVVLADPLDSAFEMLITGFPTVDDLLRADLGAQRAHPLAPEERGLDNPAYIRAFWERAGDLAAERMAYGTAMIASYWMTAWEMAGRPDLSPLGGSRARQLSSSTSPARPSANITVVMERSTRDAETKSASSKSRPRQRTRGLPFVNRRSP